MKTVKNENKSNKNMPSSLHMMVHIYRGSCKILGPLFHVLHWTDLSFYGHKMISTVNFMLLPRDVFEFISLRYHIPEKSSFENYLFEKLFSTVSDVPPPPPLNFKNR